MLSKLAVVLETSSRRLMNFDMEMDAEKTLFRLARKMHILIDVLDKFRVAPDFRCASCQNMSMRLKQDHLEIKTAFRGLAR